MRDAGVKLGLAVVLLLVGGAALYLAVDQAPRTPGTPVVEWPAESEASAGPPGFAGVPPAPAKPLERKVPAPPEHDDDARAAAAAFEAGDPSSPSDAVLDGTVSDAASRSDMTGFEVLLWDAETVESSGGVDCARVTKAGEVVAPGRFHFGGLERGGRYFVGARSLGFLSQVKGPVSPSLPNAPEPLPWEADGRVHLDLHTPGHLVVRVFDEQRQPLPGAAVRCSIVKMPWPVLNDLALQSPYERTDVVHVEEGTLVLRNLAPGEYWVAAGYADLLSLPLRVQITDAGTSDLDIVVGRTEDTGKLHVHVIDTSGKVVPDASVSAKRVLGAPTRRSHWFEQDRTFQGHFENLPVGFWIVEAWTESSDRGGLRNGSTTVGISPGLMTECTVLLGTWP